jgi:hypothetical protein
VLTTFGRQLVAVLTAAAMLTGLAVPPVRAHTHSIPQASHPQKSKTVHHHHGGKNHGHPHHHHDDESGQRHVHVSDVSAGTRHVHTSILFLDFTFPLSSDPVGDDGEEPILTLSEKSPTLQVRSAPVLVPLPILVGQSISVPRTLGAACRTDAAACLGFARPLCDTARLARSGVLIT